MPPKLAGSECTHKPELTIKVETTVEDINLLSLKGWGDTGSCPSLQDGKQIIFFNTTNLSLKREVYLYLTLIYLTVLSKGQHFYS